MINIVSHFPKENTPREGQIRILERIQKALDSKKKFIIIQAPTGAGKSHIAATLAGYSDPVPSLYHSLNDGVSWCGSEDMEEFPPWGAAILTVTKSLQGQYGKLFESSRILKGRNNYICAVDDDFDCDLAPCTANKKILYECADAQRCPLINARREALGSKFAIYNYSMYLLLPPKLRKRQFLICDEASELEDELVKNFTCDINYAKMKRGGIDISKLLVDDNEASFAWLNDLHGILCEKIADIDKEIKNNKNNKSILLKLFAKHALYNGLKTKIDTVISASECVEYITEISKDGVIFAPLYVDKLSYSLFDSGETIILMSATLIDPPEFAKTLGIREGEYEYIEIDSTFKPSNSPIFFDSSIKLNYKNIESNLPILVEKAVKICDHFKEQKGIIHTHTFKITEALTAKVKNNDRFLVRNTGVTNEYILNEHYLREDGTVLISPSMGFGVDLKGEFGVFGIVMKTPFLPLGSKRIKKLANLNPSWYDMKTLVCLVQMCGRTTRDENDKSYTFILDGVALDLIRRNINKLPAWFVKRIH